MSVGDVGVPLEGAASRPSRPRIAWMAVRRYLDHGLTDAAATLTYFAMMSLFPALLTAISLLGLIGSADLATNATRYLADHGANPATRDAIESALKNLTSQSAGKSGATLLIGIVLALNGASGAYGAAGRALNAVNDVREDRGFAQRKVADLGATLVVVLLFGAVLVALFVGGGLADDLFGKIGLGATAAAVWSVARWPVAIILALLAFGTVYAYAPNLPERKVRWLSPGVLTAAGIWILGSALFGVFLRNFPSYGAAYGAFGAAIVLLLWLYISANAFLYGAELDATLRDLGLQTAEGPPFLTPPPQAPGGEGPAARSGD